MIKGYLVPRDFSWIENYKLISLKAQRRLPIDSLEVKYQFFVHPNINKTNRIKENNVFFFLNFVTVLAYFLTDPRPATLLKRTLLQVLPSNIVECFRKLIFRTTVKLHFQNFWSTNFWNLPCTSETCSGPCQTPKIELFAKVTVENH